MIDEIVTLKVRATASFREKLALTAKENNRSMNAEIVARLEKSFEEYEDYKLYSHFMMETYKQQQQKIDELHQMVQALTNKKE